MDIILAAESMDFPRRPKDLHAEDGYVYAVEFGNGIVKVGRTENPANRLRSHSTDGERFGNGITRWWLSKPHRLYKENETSIKNHCKLTGSITGGTEYFLNVSLEEIVQFATALTIELSTPEQVESYKQHKEDGVRAMREWLKSGSKSPEGKEDWQTVLVPRDVAYYLSFAFASPAELLARFEKEPSPEEVDKLIPTLEEMAEILETEFSDVIGWEVHELLMEYVRGLNKRIEYQVKASLFDMGSAAFNSAWGFRTETVNE